MDDYCSHAALLIVVMMGAGECPVFMVI